MAADNSIRSWCKFTPVGVIIAAARLTQRAAIFIVAAVSAELAPPLRNFSLLRDLSGSINANSQILFLQRSLKGHKIMHKYFGIIQG